MDSTIFADENSEDLTNSEYLTKGEYEDSQKPTKNLSELTYYMTEFDVSSLHIRLKDKEIIIPSYKNGDKDKENLSTPNFEEGEEDSGVEVKPFQRGYVWTDKQKDRLIESIILEYPMPNIFLISQQNGTFSVLDGQQRLTTIRDFMNGDYKLGRYIKELEDKGVYLYKDEKISGREYKELPKIVRRKFNNYRIPATIIKPLQAGASKGEDSNSIELSSIYTIFERLNSGGTQLTPHEVRMATFAGDLMEYFNNLNKNKNWRSLYGPENKRSRDHELIIRIFAMYMYRENYNGTIKDYLNEFCDYYKNKLDYIKGLQELFEKSVFIIDSSNLHTAAFRTREDGKSTVNVAWSESYVSALMDTLHTYGDRYTDKQYTTVTHDVWKTLIENDTQTNGHKSIKTYIESNTSSKEAYKKRFNIVKDQFIDLLSKVD